MLFSTQTPTDIVAELEQLVGNLFTTPGRREIELMKSRIAERERNHQNAEGLRRQLALLVAEQLKRECAA